jgi:hypothetical protein
MRCIRRTVPFSLVLLACLAAPARAQEQPAATAHADAAVVRLDAGDAGAPGPRRNAWGEPFGAAVADRRAPGAPFATLMPGTSARGDEGPLQGFGIVDVAVGAVNGALWGLLWSAFSDDVVAGEGASRGALAGVVTVTAIWTAFGPIF